VTPGTVSPPPTPQPAATAAAHADAVSVQFWDLVWGPPEYVDTAKKLVGQFTQQQPTIKVSYQSVPWATWYPTFVTAIGAGTAPDLSTGGAFQAAYFATQGAIRAIDDVIQELQKNGKIQDFVAGTVDSLRVDGHYLALPWAIDIRIPSYREDLFQKAGVAVPQTWDELQDVMQKLSTGQQYGMVSEGDTVGSQQLWMFMLNNDGGLFTADKKVDLLNPRNVEALRYFASFVTAKTMAPGSAGYTVDDATKVFARGGAAIYIHSPVLYQQFPKLKIGVLPPLTSPHGTVGTAQWINNLMIYQQTKWPDDTKTFLQWWSDNQKPLWTEGHNGQLVVRPSFLSDPYFKNDPILKLIFDQWVPIGHSLAYHDPQIFPELNAIEGEGWAQTMVTELLQGKDVQETIQKADAHLKTLIKS
jgi:multiple sugar transport system substrate-binding protein